jgi:(1->4)-alpha-D-glucan 1-alpha-D-glucosylmutase
VSAAYRLQLGPDLGFAQARALVPYLRDLGVTHLYLSPVLQAMPGSTHGYDVVDPSRVSDDLGGEAELRRLCQAGLHVILDIVPNHMRRSDDNPFWSDPRRRRRSFDIDPETGQYRRFFDVDDLAGVRVEDEEVFTETHRVVLSLVADGLVSGVRVDHVDGLADPARYLARLRSRGVERIWVEKILQPGEALRDWPVLGTTGYDFLNEVGGLFVDPAGEEPLTRLWHELSGDERRFEEIARGAKLAEAVTTFAPEVEWLDRELDEAAGDVDLPLALSSLPVYRTYVEPRSGRVDDADRAVVARAGIPEPLARILLLEQRGHDTFVTRFQQTTGPIMAKGVEDTALYRYNRLVALNEVGGEPSRFGVDVAAFHAANLERARRFPHGLLTTHTHDTKRSGDVRMRIAALSALAAEWRERVLRWRELNRPCLSGPGPDASEEYLVYQTLLGAWPIEPDRLVEAMLKSIREAKRNTAWVDGNPEWEQSVERFCRRLYENEPFVRDLAAFVDRVARLGERASLGQLVLKLTSPGLPDIYQGDELWSLQLVDPDNRRPVDFDRRRETFAELRAGAAPERETMKLFVTHRVLQAKAQRRASFLAAYTPLDAGPDVCAFLRGDDVLVVVTLRHKEPVGDAPRLPPDLAGAWTSVLTGARVQLRGELPVAELLEGQPAAVLLRD